MKKIIHYCWFGDKPLPPLAKKCIKSWKKYLPDYEIVCWNEKNFDVNSTKFSKTAYEAKKWAFVSDVARIYALREQGGIYFDTDMMITKDVADIVDAGLFAAWETDLNVAVGVLGVSEKNHPVIEKLYEFYKNTELNLEDLFSQSIPALLTRILKKDYGLKNEHLKNQFLEDGIVIYARDYFYPISSDDSADMFTENTCMIHYYIGSWLPRSQRIRNRAHAILGEAFGDVFLDWAVSVKNALKMTVRFFLYPAVKKRRSKITAMQQQEMLKPFQEAYEKIEKSDYMVFYNPEWFGTSIATKELFEHTCPLKELSDEKVIQYIADKITEGHYKLVAFSAFAKGWEKLVKEIRKRDASVVIKVIWHGSNCMNIEEYDWEMFSSLFRMLEDKVINRLCFVKKSMYEFYKQKGYDVEFLMNTLSLEKPESPKTSSEDEKHTRIGLYASGDRWVKNFYNQLCAASLMEGAKVECTPLNRKTTTFADMIQLDVTGNYAPIPREELLKSMAKNALNLYVTFTECAPLIPLESFELGVPCLTGNNHHYWENHELRKYVVVDEADDVMKIYEKMKYCLENKEKILELYREWKKEYDIEARKSIERFLSI